VIEAQAQANQARIDGQHDKDQLAALVKRQATLLLVGIGCGIAAIVWAGVYLWLKAKTATMTSFALSPAYALAFGAMIFIQLSQWIEWKPLPWVMTGESVAFIALMFWHMTKKNEVQIAAMPPTKGTP
jgi:hypothetical protein